MNIKRCDRCGEEIKINTNWLDAITDAIQTVITTVTKKPVYEITNKTTGMRVDFCPACQKSFEDWLREKHPEEKQEKPKVRKAYIIPEPEMPNVEDFKFGDF